MAEVQSIEDRINSVSNKTTVADLDALKRELDSECLAPEKLQSLRAIVEAKAEVNDVTKTKLRVLLQDCVSWKKEQVPESKSSFDQVFEGAKSETFSLENVKKFEKFIDESFKGTSYEKLEPKQQGNIRLAIMDRLLKDPKIQGLFDMKIWVVDILGNMTKGNGPKSPKDAEEAKKSPSIIASISQAEFIFNTITSCLAIATKPLSDLLKDTSKNPSLLLSNPEEIAKYEGGEVSTDIREMSPIDMKKYIESLKWNVHKIDDKIFPMEQVKEQGMNFLAHAPDFLVTFFKWLISFDFIAKLLGYSGTETERNWQLDEELRQRKSIITLREFGKVSDISEGKIEGTKKEGKYSGKIKILEGQDLSWLKRDKLVDFFMFTAEEKIDATTPDFWMGVFNKSEVIVKDDKEGDITYTLEKPIGSKDLDKDFEGLYKKLNSFLGQKRKRDFKEQQAKKPLPTWEKAPSANGSNDMRKPVSLTEISTLVALGKLTSEQQSEIIMGDVQWKWIMSLPKNISQIEGRGILAEFRLLNQTCKDNPLFMKSIRKESWKTIVSLRDVLKYKDGAILALNTQYKGSVIAVATQVAALSPTQKLPEAPKTQKTPLVEAFETAESFPFQSGTDRVNFEGGKLIIGARQFTLTVSDGGFLTPSVSNIELMGTDVKIEHTLWETKIARSEIIAWIPALLEMLPNSNKEILGAKGKLTITRTA